MALCGQAPQALELLRTAVNSTDDAGAQLRLLTLKAEVLFLDGQAERALEVFDEEIAPRSTHLAHEEALIVQDNRGLAAMSARSHDAVRDHYLVADEQYVSGVQLRNTANLLDAWRAADEGKHFEALPALWKEFLHANRNGSWRAQLLASQQLAREFCQIGWFGKSAHFALIGRDASLLEQIAHAMLALNDREIARRIPELLVSRGNLRVHARLVCLFLKACADAISLAGQPSVTDFILRWAATDPTPYAAFDTFTSSWEALAALAPQLAADRAAAFANRAVHHAAWNDVPRSRPILVRALAHLIPLLDRPTVRIAAQALLPCATTCKNDFDYALVLEALRLAYAHADEITQKEISVTLLPAGRSEVPGPLARLLPEFGRKDAAPMDLASYTETVIQNVSNLVQRIPVGQEPVKTPGFGQITSTKGGVKMVVSIGAPEDALAVIANHPHLLSRKLLGNLVATLLSSLQDSDNLLMNRISLAQALARLAPKLRLQHLREFVSALMRLAHGDIAEPSPLPTSAEARNPLSNIQIDLGTPSLLQGFALMTLAGVQDRKRVIPQKDLISVLATALAHQDPAVRKFAYAATRLLRRIPASLLVGVLLGTRDRDPDAAASAFYALCGKGDSRFAPGYWEFVLQSVGLASNAAEPAVRRAAATLVADLRAAPDATSHAARLHALADMLSRDICFSVRRAVETTPHPTSGAAQDDEQESCDHGGGGEADAGGGFAEDERAAAVGRTSLRAHRDGEPTGRK